MKGKLEESLLLQYLLENVEIKKVVWNNSISNEIMGLLNVK